MEYIPDNYDYFLEYERRQEEVKERRRWKRLEEEGMAIFEAEEGEVYETIRVNRTIS